MGSAGLPTLSQKRVLKALARLDVHDNGKGKGSHIGVTGPTGRRSLVQYGQLPGAYIATILKQLEISVEDFLDVV